MNPSTDVQTGSRRSILIIDDNLIELRVIVSILRNADYQLIISTNGRDGLSRAAVLKPDLILCDVRMPDISGFVVARRLRSDPTTSEIPLIFLTACTDTHDRIEGLKLGAVDYINKPAHEEEVLLRVGIHISAPRLRPGAHTTLDAPRTPTKFASENDSILLACKELLEKDLATNISMDELAKSVGTHRKKLNDIFREAFGVTVYDYLQERRIQAAKAYLTHSNVSIHIISETLGFTSAANFSTAFKDRVGASPTSYRKSILSYPPEGDLTPLAGF